MSNILITGSNKGFLGYSTRLHLSQNHKCIPLDYKSYENQEYELKEFFKPDVLINFAWGGGSDSKYLNGIEQFENIKYCIDLFNFGLKIGVKKFIGIGSSWETSLFGLNNYGFCKDIVRKITAMMTVTSDIEMNWIVPYWTYGPNDKPNRFIPTIINKCLKNEKIELHPSQNLVDYLFIDDFCEAIDIILRTHFNNYQSYNICSGRGYKIKDIVEKIKSLTNSKSEITYNKDYPSPNFNMEWVGDNSKIKELGWIEKVTLEEGLIKTIDFYAKRNNGIF